MNGVSMRLRPGGRVGFGQDDGGSTDDTSLAENALTQSSGFQLNAGAVPEGGTASGGNNALSNTGTNPSFTSGGGGGSSSTDTTSSLDSSTSDSLSAGVLGSGATPWIVGGLVLAGGAAAYEWYKQRGRHHLRRAFRR